MCTEKMRPLSVSSIVPSAKLYLNPMFYNNKIKYLPALKGDKSYTKTRMTTFIKTKFNKSGDQTNIDNIE